MEARLIGIRHSLQARRTWQAQLLIETKRRGNVTWELEQASLECGGILNRLCATLTHERQHRMARVPQERHPAERPARQRCAVKQGPFVCLVYGANDREDVGVPSRECSKNVGNLSAVDP